MVGEGPTAAPADEGAGELALLNLGGFCFWIQWVQFKFG